MKKEDTPDVNRARRLLLKTGIYAAPIILDVIRIKTAHAQQNQSCGPYQCNPAVNMCKPRN